jgi:hypothetical protein
MKRVFQKEDFEALAAKATLAAPADVLRRFYIPVSGTLTCEYAGAQTPEAQELVVYNTLVTFEWKLRGPRVQGTVSQTWEAHNAMRMLPGSGVPFRLKHPLVAAFLHVKLRSRKLLLAVLCTPSLSDDVHVRLHGIAMSKPIVEQFRKTIVNKRRRGTDMEAPICARISDTHSLSCLPREAGARAQFRLGRDKLRRVVDDGSTKPSTGMSVHATRLDLPADLSAYDKRPWRCLRCGETRIDITLFRQRAIGAHRALDDCIALEAVVRHVSASLGSHALGAAPPICLSIRRGHNFDNRTHLVMFTMPMIVCCICLMLGCAH